MPATAATLRKLFFGAIAIRWLYDLALYAAMGPAGLMEADLRGYLGSAKIMAASVLHGGLQGWDWLGPDLHRMPLYPWLVTINVVLFGSLAPLTTVMVQGVIDGGTCLLIYKIAKTIDLRFALPAAIAAAVNPTQIVLSGLIYTDTLFVFFITLFLTGAALWLHSPSWRAALTTGIGLGCAGLARILVAPWVPVMLLVLLAAAFVAGRLRPRHIAQLAAMAAIFGLCIAPILARNVTQYGSWSLTDQGGAHLALWVVATGARSKRWHAVGARHRRHGKAHA